MITFLGFLVLFRVVISAPFAPKDDALAFMKKFGYIIEEGPSVGSIYTEEGLSNILKEVQKFGAIEQTGVLDNATLNLMKSPRCGVPDIIRESNRKKRFILGTGGWEKRDLTYFIANWSPKLGEDKVARNIQRALDTWASYGRLRFRRSASQDADIIVAFASGYHGDSFPFDGRGNVLAHAFFPSEHDGLGGDIHFDDDEPWADFVHSAKGEIQDGTDFYSVALHELGHSLGLAHSPVDTSVMFPYYKGYEGQELRLDYDDILAMYNLYITRRLKDEDQRPATEKEQTTSTTTPEPYTTTTTTTRRYYPTESTTTTKYSTYPTWYTTRYVTTKTKRPPYYDTTTSRTTDDRTITYEGDHETVDDHKKHDKKHNIPKTNSPSLPHICQANFDAVASLRGELFIFKDEYIWRLRNQGKIENGYPITINQMFPTFPKKIKKLDAVYQRPDGKIVFFIGREVWIHDGRDFIENSPKSLEHFGLPKELDSIDAVQNWSRNRKTYFYKNDRFWRYNEETKTMDEGYPMSMDRWRGVPSYLNSATTWKDTTYFFKGDLFWKFDNNWVIATDTSPMPIAQIWLGCPEDEETMRNRRYG